MNNPHIVVFDGVCNFCNGAVNFIIKRDPQGVFVFTPMQSDLAKALIKKHGIDANTDTFMLIKHDQCYVFSTAALEITKELTGAWYLFNAFKVVPAVFRDLVYKAFARHRYSLFGRQTACIVPTKELRSRFIGI